MAFVTLDNDRTRQVGFTKGVGALTLDVLQ